MKTKTKFRHHLLLTLDDSHEFIVASGFHIYCKISRSCVANMLMLPNKIQITRQAQQVPVSVIRLNNIILMQ